MQWEFVIALALAVPLILFPVFLVWFLNIGGMMTAVKQAARRRGAGGGREWETRKRAA